MNLRFGLTKILFTYVPALMMVAVFTFVIDVRAQSASEATEIFRTQIYPYVSKNCSACHGDGKSDIEYSAPNWLHKDIASTEKQIQGYLRGETLEKTKIYSQVKSQHWAKTSPSGLEKEYGEKNINNFSKVFAEYFKNIGIAKENSDFIAQQTTTQAADIVTKKRMSVDGDEIDIFDLHSYGLKNLNDVEKKLKIIQMSSAGMHTCALFENGGVKCWGNNGSGQLGLGDQKDRGSSPYDMGNNLPYVDLGGEKIIQVSAGLYHTCVLFENGRVKCWGDNGDGQLGLSNSRDRGSKLSDMGNRLPYTDLGDEKIKQVIAGGYHTCALFENDRLKCWGKNYSGQLGLGNSRDRGLEKSEMGNNLPYVDLGGEKIIQVSAGYNHTCVLFENGSLKCWGDNNSGQLGLGDMGFRGNKPSDMGNNLPYVDLGGEKIIQVSAGGQHTCTLFENGRVKCWGKNIYGQLGLGDSKTRGREISDMGNRLPYVDHGEERLIQVSAAGYHTCALFENNRVKCWGYNEFGQLGLPVAIRSVGGKFSDEIKKLKYLLLGDEKIKFISTQNRHVCAHSDYQVYCFGNNEHGRLGQGHDVMYVPGDSFILPGYNSIVPPTLVQ